MRAIYAESSISKLTSQSTTLKKVLIPMEYKIAKKALKTNLSSAYFNFFLNDWLI